jgi:hypothetical protein
LWPELIVVIHGEYIPPDTHTVNLLEGRGARMSVSTIDVKPLTGQQGTPALCPTNREFCLFFIFIFWREFIFLKKIIENFIFSVFFFSLFLSCTHTLGSQKNPMNFTKVRCEGKLKKGVVYNRHNLQKWNLTHKVQGELCEDHLYPKEYWETPIWTT